MPQWIHDRAKHIQAKNPSMPESEAWAIATQQSHALGKSPKSYGTAKGRATAKNKYKTPEDDQKKAASVLVELTKHAFGVSQYSGPLNPVIAGGASTQPPRKAPQLQRAIQKTAELWPGFFEELLKVAAAVEGVNIGQWWEQVGGPHLAKGGDHKTFKKMMNEVGIPPGMQAKFERVAKEKYPPGHTSRRAAGPGAGATSNPFDGFPDGYDDELPSFKNMHQWLPGVGALGALGVYSHLNKEKEETPQTSSALRSRAGAHLMTTLPLGLMGHSFGRALAPIAPKAPAALGAGGAALGALLGESLHRHQETLAKSTVNRALGKGRTDEQKQKSLQRFESASRDTTAKSMRSIASPRLLPALGMISLLGARPLGILSGSLAGAAAGAPLLEQYRKRRSHEMAQERMDKAAAGAPTRGNFMMASDIPPFKAPRLDRAIQKDSAFGKEKDGDMLSDYVTYSPGDFKKSKYAMSLEELGSFVSELLEKDAAIASPASQLAKTQHVGAPKASAPPGPSIAAQAKPKGSKFGIGIPGAFKTKL